MSMLNQDLYAQLVSAFRNEGAEHVETINQSLLQLERAPAKRRRQKLLQDAFRAAHSLKGAARAVSLAEIESLAHALESVLQQARDADLPLEADACDTLYQTLDTIGGLIDGQTAETAPLLAQLRQITAIQAEAAAEISAAQAAAPVTPSPQAETAAHAEQPAPGETPAPHPTGDETIRVSIAKLDDLMAQIGELLVSKINAEQRQTDARQLADRFEQWEATWRELKLLLPHLQGETGQKLGSLLARHAEQMRELNQAFAKFSQDVRRDTTRLGMVTADLQDRVRTARMVPFQTLTPILERAVRDIARSAGKQITFTVKGGDIELDKKILETLKDPLLHLLRNAVGHGIESSAERQAVGKSPEGIVALTIRQRGSEVRLVVEDDGRGFALEQLLRIGRERGLLNDAATDEEVLGLAFLPGISTATEVTLVSGRGIGLDVVRQSLESIQGRIAINNRAGRGVALELVAPVSLAMTRGLIVRIGAERYVIPLLSIESIVAPENVLFIGGKSVLNMNGTPLPLVALATVLERPAATGAKPAANPLVLIIAVADQRLALLVDEVQTELEIAVKSLGNPLQRVRNVAGAALLGNGEPIIVLNPADLVRSAGRAAAGGAMVQLAEEEEDSLRSIHILVVDDSITTRTLEENILEVAGYTVVTATHGLEALQRLKEYPINVVVADIQMPHMDGFALTEHLRQSQEYRHLPIILVTSLEGQEDRERGMTAGADAYIVKRGFDQAELLATIQRFL